MFMFKPKISIITITYNSEKTLENTINSVISQDYDNLEYIIIDGGSKDQTLEIINRYRDKIAYFVSEPDRGISDAFNKGIKAATGEVIGIINSDDLLAEGALQALCSEYDPSIDVYRGNLCIWDDKTNTKYTNVPTMKFPINKKISAVCHPSTFITKEAYKKWGQYREDMKYMMDADILYRMYAHKASFKYIGATLAVFRLGGATSDNFGNKMPELKRLILVNEGSQFIAYKMIICSYIIEKIKAILFGLFGANNVRKIWFFFNLVE